jgi:hypothetical protein
MAYLGNTPEQQAFTPRVDYFSGNGSTTAFTLSFPVASVAQVQAVIENVPQNPGDAYTVSGNTITFTSAPPSGTNNIYVYYTSPITTVITPGYGTVGAEQLKPGAVTAPTPTAVSDQLNSSTGYFDLPAGTTAQRPGTPVNGMVRYNTTINQFEVYQNSAWTQYTTTYSIEYLIVAGGGGGGGGGTSGVHGGGGGGAGGYLSLSSIVSGGVAYSIAVGAGGSGGSTGAAGAQGSSSSGFGISSVGGGFGNYGLNGYDGIGGSGGSGGGATRLGAGGSATSGQGNVGGSGTTNGGSNDQPGAGGGGAGAVGGGGAAIFQLAPGNGGNGLTWLNGTTYAGGGGGGASIVGKTSNGLGGTGGGGEGGNAGAGSAGTTNTGGGGGGGRQAFSGGNGGSGVVIIRYSGSQRGTGGTVTSSGGYTYHTFTTSGTFTA